MSSSFAGAGSRTIADRTEDTPGRHDQGGWSQARYQRHIEKLEHDHYKSVVEEIEDRFRRLGRPRIVVVCSDETRAELAGRTAGRDRGRDHRLDERRGARLRGELHEVVKPFVEEWRAAREAEVVERWREEVGKGSRGTAGWGDTLEAASDGRVETLLHQAGVQRDAYRCPACGRAAVSATTCPLDGTTMEPRDDGLDIAVRLTLAHGGDVLAVEHRQDLDPVDGIGAILRY